MGLDIRIPIGLMFSILGCLLTLFGALGNKGIYARSLGVNVNFIWGAILLLLGVGFLVIGFRSSRDTGVIR